MKKIFVMFLTLCMVFSLVACGGGGETITVTETMIMPTTEYIEVTEDTLPPETTTEATLPHEPVPSPEAPILDFDITGFDIVEDYEGNPALVVYLIWTNTTEETAMFATTYGVSAFQDGIGLDPAILILNDDMVDRYDDVMTEIRPGATIEVMTSFALRSDNPLVEVEVAPWISLDGNPLMLLTIDTSAKG